jgi:hypothetical protein
MRGRESSNLEDSAWAMVGSPHARARVEDLENSELATWAPRMRGREIDFSVEKWCFGVGSPHARAREESAREGYGCDTRLLLRGAAVDSPAGPAPSSKKNEKGQAWPSPTCHDRFR